MSKKIKKTEPMAAPRMYCGPNISGVANQGMLFTEPPPLLLAHMGKCPAIRSFIIAPEEYGRVKKAIQNNGSLENTQYRKVLDFLQKGA